MNKALCLVAVCCVASALAFPQYPYGQAAQLGETPQKQLQSDWANAAHNYHGAGAPAGQQAWSTAVAAETPAQMAQVAEKAIKPAGSDLPYHEPIQGQFQKAPKVSLKAATKELVGLEQKQVKEAQATLAADRSAEANDEAKVASLRAIGTEEKALDNVKLQSDETSYQNAETRENHDVKKVNSDKMHAMTEEMKVGLPQVAKGEYPLPGFPTGQQNIGM